ncbi:MAG: cyclase family protein, partial [Alphaproteobacteria bacterium]|nr:cyclase family protein [Alphaproteobacteria bacterium]
GDQKGAANRLTPDRTLAALQSVREGRIFDLSRVIQPGAPFIHPGQTPFILANYVSPRDSIKRRRGLGHTNDAGTNIERVEMTMHVGTHIDALGHFTIGKRMYGGLTTDEVLTDWGLAQLGIEHCPPMITRAVCLDVSGLDGGDHLQGGRVVSRADLKRAAEKARVAIEPGDMVMIHTGWGKLFMVDNARYVATEPGIDVEAAAWLTAQGVVAIGADSMAVEVMPNPDKTKTMPVHQHTLVENGVYLIENLLLDEVVKAGLASFCCVMLPVKFKGATGCPVRPVAVI